MLLRDSLDQVEVLLVCRIGVPMRHIIGLLLFCFLATVACSSQAFSTLVNFGGGTNGIYPNGTLVLGSDGNLYGTTSNGGDNSVGTIFEVTPDGVLNTLYSFSYSGGNEPFTGLMQANDGNFYGTTSQGGGYDVGIVYRMTPGGIVTKIHSFAGWDGVPPSGTLILATDGYLYGVASYGGTDTIGGTVYKISLQGALTVVHSFCPNRDCSEGQAPRGTLVQASDGNFYGTTSAGGPYCAGNGGCGTVFKLTPDGTLTTLHYFNQSDGAFPYAGLVLANDGNFYGTTTLGGAQNYGTVFKITPDGTFTSLHSFNNTDGRLPYGPLVQASDGYFYGATYQGGLYCQLGCGTVFRITPQGGFTSLHSFDNSDGNLSYAGMLESTDGILYGTTSSGGTNYSGTLFRLVLYAGLSVTKSGMGTVSGGDGKIYCGTMCSYTLQLGCAGNPRRRSCSRLYLCWLDRLRQHGRKLLLGHHDEREKCDCHFRPWQCHAHFLNFQTELCKRRQAIGGNAYPQRGRASGRSNSSPQQRSSWRGASAGVRLRSGKRQFGAICREYSSGEKQHNGNHHGDGRWLAGERNVNGGYHVASTIPQVRAGAHSDILCRGGTFTGKT